MSDARDRILDELDGHPGAQSDASRYHRGHYRGLLRALKLLDDAIHEDEAEEWTTTMHNAPQHGPLWPLRRLWRRWRSSDGTEEER